MKVIATCIVLLGLAALLPALSDHAAPDKAQKLPPPKAGQEDAGKQPAVVEAKPAAWTMKEAIEQLSYHPRDVYLQYVALQLLRRHNDPDDLAKILAILQGESKEGQIDLFDNFAGTLAIQEQLQRQAMIGEEILNNGALNGQGGWGRNPVPVLRAPAVPPDNLMQGYKAGSLFLMAAPMPTTVFPGNLTWSPIVTQMISDETLAPLLLQAVAKTEKEKRKNEWIPMTTLTPGDGKFLPWEKLLAGKKPQVSALSLCVPENFFFIEFRSASKMPEILNALDDWTCYLVSQASFDARSHQTAQRLQKQLALEGVGDPKLLELVVDEIAVTGSDFFLQEGTDVTVLIKHKQPKLFQTALTAMEARFLKDNQQVQRTTGKVRDVDFVLLSTPDHTVHVFTANPRPQVHIRSNSRTALERVLDALHGKNAEGKPVSRLGETAEFKYIRTQLPHGAAEEDGLVYFSETFLRIRNGPQLKLAERRRLMCYNHLRMIGHASQMYRTETGKSAANLQELLKAKCLPEGFNKDNFVCANGGKYTLVLDELGKIGQGGVCSHHGRVHSLRPCLESPLAKVNREEAEAYQEFADNAKNHFVMPLALRLQVTARRYRIEAFAPAAPFEAIIPEFGKQVKDSAEAVGLVFGRPEPLDALPVPKGNLFTLNFKLNGETAFKDLDRRIKELEAWTEIGKSMPWLPQLAGSMAAIPATSYAATTSIVLTEIGLEPSDNISPRDMLAMALLEKPELRKLQLPALLARGVGNQIGVHVYDARIMMDMNWAVLFQPSVLTGPESLAALGIIVQGGMAPALLAPVYVSVPVKDAKVVDEFLDHLDKEMITLVRHRVKMTRSLDMQPDFYKLSLKSGVQARALGIRIGPTRFRMFWARIGNGLYLTNQAGVLDDIQAAELARGKGGAVADAGPEGHVMLRLRPENWNHALPGFKLGWAETNREACQHNLGALSSAARAFTAEAASKGVGNQSWDERSRRACELADGLHCVHHFCPDAGKYRLSQDGKAMTCSIHGSTLSPKQANAPTPDSNLERILRDYAGFTGILTFQADGIRLTLTVDRGEKE